MKVTLVAAVVLLLAAVCSETLAEPVAPNTPTICCFRYQTQRIPKRAIEDYFYTSSVCSKPGLVFVTRKGREVCANPEDKWVKDYMNSL
ncbi:C-C motif chemokine 4 homolog [Latimeria chalumnae]|uniref:C-C motif chemokine n=1 Tax=Latimeria chalumnae TaxID=7897 RepID=M3XGQ4_LATCH|nr:PREDICTED: C-C motif chemokine 4 homolog [Latimeria chalumnae]|eukprot:XP_005986935.1 PREDICTED: C-C motif chemokine 4 homolog [Latimeria chalumnae]